MWCCDGCGRETKSKDRFCRPCRSFGYTAINDDCLRRRDTADARRQLRSRQLRDDRAVGWQESVAFEPKDPRVLIKIWLERMHPHVVPDYILDVKDIARRREVSILTVLEESAWYWRLMDGPGRASLPVKSDPPANMEEARAEAVRRYKVWVQSCPDGGDEAPDRMPKGMLLRVLEELDWYWDLVGDLHGMDNYKLATTRKKAWQVNQDSRHTPLLRQLTQPYTVNLAPGGAAVSNEPLTKDDDESTATCREVHSHHGEPDCGACRDRVSR